jgi:hypothetical protein
VKRSASVVAALWLAACGGCPDNNGTLPVIDVDASDASSERDAGSVDVGADLRDPPRPAIIGSRLQAPAQLGVNPDGAGDIDSTLSGEARAGRIAGDTGFTGLWSHCKTGDFKLYNGRIEVCISNEQSNRYEMFAGGGLVDARVVGNTADDVFDLYAPRIGFNTLHAESVEVVRDGSDGGPAVVRAAGTDMPAAYFVGVAGEQAFSPNGLDVSVEYRLGPDADFVEIVTFVTNDGEAPVQNQRGDMLAFGDRARDFRQWSGLGNQSSNDPFHWIAAAGAGHSFAWVVPDEPLDSLSAVFGDPPWELTQTDATVLEPGETSVHFGRLLVGDGRIDAIVKRARELLVRPTGEPREVTVVESDGRPAAGRWVEVFDTEGRAVTAGRTDTDGVLQVSVPEGMHRLVVQGVVGGGGLEETRQLGAEPLQLEVPSTATVRVEATADGRPAITSVQASSAAGNVESVTAAGEVELEVVPGEWTITVGKGPEYDRFTTTVTAVAGEVETLQPNLTRVVDTTDWIAGDFHQHMEPSSDSTVRVEDRILDNVAQGVELITPTDHDVVTDLVPYIAEMGLGDVVATIPGAELSPSLAHTNVYPMPWDPTAPGRGTVPLAVLENGQPRRRTVPELIAAARELPTDPVVQINHGRDSSGLFELVGFDPEVGPDGVDDRWWTPDFDAIEVINGDRCLELWDWAGLWNAGLTPTGIGSSDSHGLWGRVGSSRTYLYMPAVQPADVLPEDVRDAVRDGRVIVAGDAFMAFTDGTLPGDEITDTSADPVDFGVQVQTPTWASVDTITVVVNGDVVETIDVTSVSDFVDFDDVVSIDETSDFWVVFFATGPGDAYAFNNPVRVDRDGDGFQAPGPRPLGMQTLPFCQ